MKRYRTLLKKCKSEEEKICLRLYSKVTQCALECRLFIDEMRFDVNADGNRSLSIVDEIYGIEEQLDKVGSNLDSLYRKYRILTTEKDKDNTIEHQ